MWALLKEKIENAFRNKTPEEKRKLVILIVLISLLIIGLIAYKINRGGVSQQVAKSNVTVDLKPLGTPSQLEQAQYVEMQATIEKMKQELEEMKRLYNQTIEERKKLEESLEVKDKEGSKKKDSQAISMLPPPPPPPPPPLPVTSVTSPGVGPGPQPGDNRTVVQIKAKQELGGIKIIQGKEEPKKGEASSELVSGTQVEQKLESKESRELKKKIYLPPSFMEATILSGLDAPAVTKGQGHPVPVLLRVNTPAVLPNMVKANLRGCFVIAEGLGNLASERVDLRLVSLSCIDKKGRAVIDQPISGFVVDSDGKIGLRGRVVSKMGSVIARAMLAGLFSGLGQGLVTSNQNISLSPIGSLTTIDPEKAAIAALGSGVNKAMEQISKFYLELAQQTIPVVEVLPTRKVTVVISKGTELSLREYDFGQ